MSDVDYSDYCVTVESIICECGESFENEDLFNEHSVLCRSREDEFNEVEHKCELCHSVYAERSLLDAHIEKVHINVNNDPDIGSRFRSRGRYSAKSRVCEVCGKTCPSAAALTYHMRTHTGERPYQCPQCPKKFAMQMLLMTHLRVHTGERPYECDKCPKAFSNKAALNRHMRVHTGAKPYPCPECGKCFSQSNSTKLHYRTVHLKEPAPYKKKPKVKNEPANIEYGVIDDEYDSKEEMFNRPRNVAAVSGNVAAVSRNVAAVSGNVAAVPEESEDFFSLNNTFTLKGKKIKLVKVKSEPVVKVESCLEPKYAWQ